MIDIRDREAADADPCVEALQAVYQASGYPVNWPDDPARWLRPPGTLRAWVAVAGDMPVAGHLILRRPAAGERRAEVSRLFVVPAARRQGVAAALLETAMRAAAASDLGLFLDVTDHLRAARALYERAGFRLIAAAPADWTTPDGGPVTLHRYAWSPGPSGGHWQVNGLAHRGAAEAYPDMPR
jgi:GNAT superfamily N-acetyltransferase